MFWVFLLAIANLFAIAAWGILAQVRARQSRRQVELINATIRDYFHHSGVEVHVASVHMGNDRRFTVLIESEPMKQFRLSHIIEMTLREHVTKTCTLELDKIYWRFPLKEATSPEASAVPQQVKTNDDYINEGLVTYRHLPKVDVQEISWEKFEEFTTRNSDTPPATKPQAH